VSGPSRLLQPAHLAAGALAVGIFVIAFLSPVEHVDSDPAMALLVSQALLDHHTLRLDVYAGDPACAYLISPANYHLFLYGDSLFYRSPSVGVLSLPIVWLANRFGFYMLDQSAEFALQNLISAVCCALIAGVLYRLCRIYLAPPASLAVAAVSVLGSDSAGSRDLLGGGAGDLDVGLAAEAALTGDRLPARRALPGTTEPPTPPSMLRTGR